MGKKLTLTFSFSFETPIWRMLPDETAKKWVLELRDTSTHEVQYTVIDFSNKQLFKQDLLLEDAWWTGITAFQEDKLLVHRFEDSENPEGKTFYILNLQTGRIEWQSERFIFVKMQSNELYGYEKTAENEQIYKIISLEDHSERITEPVAFDQKIRQLTIVQEKNKPLIYPFYYPQEHTYFATVRAFLNQFMHIQPVYGCEYLEHQGAIIISYYIYEDKSLSNYLLVMNQAQEVLLHDKIGSRLDGLGVDTFFVVKNRLIFIKEKYQLVSYALDNVQ